MLRIIETEDHLQEGLVALGRIAPDLVPALALCTDVPLRRRTGGFAGLAGIIVSQQVSVASARAIMGRVEQRFCPLEAPAIAAADEMALRGCGLSGPKIRALQAAATAVMRGELDFSRLPELPAAEAHAALCGVKGIGPWTADVYLMFCIGHADAFAAGDLALQEAARLIFALPARPSAKELVAMAEAWRPWRAVAARLLWRYYALVRQREGAPVPA